MGRFLVMMVSLLLLSPAAASARSAHGLMLGPYAGADVSPAAAVSPFLDAYGAWFGYVPSVSVTTSLRRVGPTWVVRLDQHVAGIPVRGAGLVLKVDDAGRVRSAAGTVVDVAALDTVPALDASAALARIPDGGDAIRVPELVVVHGGTDIRLAWEVSTSGAAGSYRHWVDAHSGDLLFSWNVRMTADGRWYETNPVASPVPVTGELPVLDSPGDVLTGAYADVYACGTLTMGECSLLRHATPDMAGDYLYDPPVPAGGVFDDAFAEVNAYYHVSTFSEWWETELDYLPWSYLMPLQTVVNINDGSDKKGDPESFGNAYFDPNLELIGFGQTGTRDYSYDADVTYHELTHAVVGDSLAPVLFDSLGVDVSGFGLNEGTADAFATLYTGDPFLGEYVGGSDGIRDMTNDHICPYDLFGEPHEDGKIWGAAAWDAREHLEMVLGPGAGALAMAVLLSRALQAIPFNAGYAGFTDELLDQAWLDPVYAPIAPDLEAIYTARGLVGCERIIDLNNGEPHAGTIYGKALFIAQAPNVVPGPFQYKITVPEAAALSIGIFVPPSSLPTFYVRRGAPVTFSGFGASLTALEYDWEFTNVPSGEIGPDSDPPIEPGDYYIIMGNRGLGSMFYALSAGLVPVDITPEPSDAGAGDSGTDAGVDETAPSFGVAGGPGGCAISATQAPGVSGLWWIVPVVGLILARRRRRP